MFLHLSLFNSGTVRVSLKAITAS